MKAALIVGSLRKGSFNRMMAKNLIELAPSTLKLEIVEIDKLSFYNQDLDETPPQEWTDFREKIKNFDGIVFVSPEYNRSVPAVLKNAIDIGSRPYGHSVWDGKPAAVMTVSPGAAGGFGSNHHIRQSLVFVNMPCMNQPEAYIGGAAKMFDDKGKITSESTRTFVQKFISAFDKWLTDLGKNNR